MIWSQNHLVVALKHVHRPEKGKIHTTAVETMQRKENTTDPKWSHFQQKILCHKDLIAIRIRSKGESVGARG